MLPLSLKNRKKNPCRQSMHGFSDGQESFPSACRQVKVGKVLQVFDWRKNLQNQTPSSHLEQKGSNQQTLCASICLRIRMSTGDVSSPPTHSQCFILWAPAKWAGRRTTQLWWILSSGWFVCRWAPFNPNTFLLNSRFIFSKKSQSMCSYLSV